MTVESYLRKKLFYQSVNRGCKELDILIGRFAEKYLYSFSLQTLSEYEEVLKMNDADLYDILLRGSDLSAAGELASSSVMQMLLDFVNSKRFATS